MYAKHTNDSLLIAVFSSTWSRETVKQYDAILCTDKDVTLENDVGSLKSREHPFPPTVLLCITV